MGEALTAVGGVYAAYGQQQAGKFNNRIAKFNATLSELQAKDAEYRGGEEAQRTMHEVNKTIGSQRASLAAQGIAIDQDTAASLVEESRRAGAADLQTIKNNTIREAWGFRVQGTNYRLGGALARATATNQAAGTLITSGAEVYKQAYSRAAASGAA